MEIRISQDIRKFKTKDVGNFSFKEVGFIVLGVGAGALTYKLADSFELALIPAAIVLVIGFFKPFGMSCIEFMRTFLRENLFTPKTYIWETDFEYDKNGFEELYGEKIAIPSSWDVIQTEQESKNKKLNKFEKAQLIR